MIYFINQEIRITDNKIARVDSLIEITNILKTKITIEKLTHLIIKREFQDATFADQNFIREKIVQMLQKNLIMIYDYLKN